MGIIQAWNQTKVIRERNESIFAKKRQMLLGTKKLFSNLPKSVWYDDRLFLKNAVSIPFRDDVRKPIKIIIIGPGRIGKTTLVSNLLDDIQNDFNVPTLSFYPKGNDAVYHNKKGKGKLLCPSEFNRSLRNNIIMPYYKEEDTPADIHKEITKFSFQLNQFDPSKEPGFMEEDPNEFPKGVYSYLSILMHNFPEVKEMDANTLYHRMDEFVYVKKGMFKDNSEKISMPSSTYEAIKTRLMKGIATKFFYDSKYKITQEKIINDWNNNRSHAITFFADSFDPRVQAYGGKALQIWQYAQRTRNILRKKKGLRPKSIWLMIDDARQLCASFLDISKKRAYTEVERCITQFGEDGWNLLLIYHNVNDVPQGWMKEADFIITSKVDKEDARKLPDELFRRVATNLWVKPFFYYNQWAVFSKDGQVRTFYALDSRVGLK